MLFTFFFEKEQKKKLSKKKERKPHRSLTLSLSSPWRLRSKTTKGAGLYPPLSSSRTATRRKHERRVSFFSFEHWKE